MNTQVTNRKPQAAFTLVELLVVITIIVVLIALLTPALDKAVYQAELAVCSADLHGLGVGVSGYASDHSRSYPYRQHVHETRAWPSTLAYGAPQWDGRPSLRPYISINATLNCPLLPRIDLEGSHNDTSIFSPHNLWFGWQYNFGGQRFPGMRRVGDRWEWPYVGAGYPQVKSSLLSGTHYVDHFLDGLAQASHPGETYYVHRLQDEPEPNGLHVGGGIYVAIGKFTQSVWDSYDLGRGPIDMTNLHADLSVLMTRTVEWDGVGDDERLARVPAYSDGVNWTTEGPNNSVEIIPKE